MRVGRAPAIFAAVLLLACSAADASKPRPVTLGEAAAETATRACVGIISQDVVFPDGLAAQNALLAGYGLAVGLPQAALDESGEFRALFNRATLAHRLVGADAFAMALGGAQPTCRLILYHVADRAATKASLAAALLSGPLAWKEAPAQQASAAAERRMFVKRSASGKPMLLNLISGKGAAEAQPIIVTVAAIPASVQLPQGF